MFLLTCVGLKRITPVWIRFLQNRWLGSDFGLQIGCSPEPYLQTELCVKSKYETAHVGWDETGNDSCQGAVASVWLGLQEAGRSPRLHVPGALPGCLSCTGRQLRASGPQPECTCFGSPLFRDAFPWDRFPSSAVNSNTVD